MTANADSRYHSALHEAARAGRRAITAALNITYTASVAAVDAMTPAAISGFRLSVIGSSVCESLLTLLFGCWLGCFEARAREREDVRVAGLPGERQLARANFPSGGRAHESIRVVAEHGLHAVT